MAPGGGPRALTFPRPAALCSFGCGSGFCVAPNLCSCPDGERGVTCPGRAPPPPPRAAGPGVRAWVAGCPRCPAEPLSAFQSRWGTAGSTAATSPVTTVGARRWPASVPSASPWWRRTPASAATVSRGERGVAAGGRGGPGVPQPPAPSPLARRHQRVPERRLRGAVRQHRGWLRLRVRPRHAARRQPPQLPGCAGPGLGGGGGGALSRGAEPRPLPGRYRRVPGHAVPAPLQEQRGQLPLLLPARLPPPREPALLRG